MTPEPLAPRAEATRTSAIVVIYDIRGFTAASRRIGTAELGAFAKEAHEVVLAAFADRPATFRKNLGDGHLLLWETPDGPDAGLMADLVERTELARTAFTAFVDRRASEGVVLPRRIGFGIAVGEVSRADDYYGEAINRASRLQNLARPEGLAIDPLVFEAASGRDRKLGGRLQRVRVRLKGLGRTRVWVARPFSWARLAPRVAAAVGVLLLPFVYGLLADARLGVPLGDRIRAWIDEREWSIFRPVRSEADVRANGDAARRALATALLAARTPDGAIGGDLGHPEDQRLDVWGSSQAICALMKAPHLDVESLRSVLPGLAVLFTDPHYVVRDGRAYGWVPHPKSPYTEAEPTLWTVAAVAAALGRPGVVPEDRRAEATEWLAKAQRASAAYRPLATGGWNMFPDQDKPDLASPYSSALALLALLETKAAGLPWEGSVETRDALLRSTIGFLSDRFHADGPMPGWRGTGESSDPISFGLTMQIYATLLRAESDAAIPIRAGIAEAIPQALIRLSRVREEDLRGTLARYDTGEFSISFKNLKGDDDERNEAINFLWHPWATDAAARWLARAPRTETSHADVVEVRRALGLLVVDLGDDAVRIARSGYTFVASETLYCLSSIPPP